MDGAIQYYELCHAHYTNWGLIIIYTHVITQLNHFLVKSRLSIG